MREREHLEDIHVPIGVVNQQGANVYLATTFEYERHDAAYYRTYVSRRHPIPKFADTNDSAPDLGTILVSLVFIADVTRSTLASDLDITPAVESHLHCQMSRFHYHE